MSLIFVNNEVLAQAAVDHLFQQDIEVSVLDRGGPTLIKKGETRVLSYVPMNGAVNFSVRYETSRRYETQEIQVIVHNGAVTIPEAPGALRKSDPVAAAESRVTPESRQTDGAQPEIGRVNVVRSLTADIPSFPLKLHNNATNKGDVLFIGGIFTGSSAQVGDTIVSREMVQPGLVEITVLYRLRSYRSQEINGQDFVLAQQAIVYMITADPSQVITITNEDFFDFAILAEDLPVRFRNTGSTTLYPKTGDRRLKPLRPGRSSKATKFGSARSTMWYYYDNGIQRLAIWELVPGDRPTINIRAMDNIYGIGK